MEVIADIGLFPDKVEQYFHKFPVPSTALTVEPDLDVVENFRRFTVYSDDCLNIRSSLLLY